MRIDDISERYPVLKDVVEKIKETDNVDELFPPQAEAIESGYLEGKNLVLAIPTCSGKTLMAELAMLKTVLEKGRKAVYIVPLKALASEKYQEFKEKYGPLGVKVGISSGDMDSSDPWLANQDIIFVTSEKMDSLLRHNITWAREIGLVVADEVHLIDSPDRGPTLEITLTKLRKAADPAILALSATINNYQELAEWLEADAVKSDFRPVKLNKGVCYEREISFPKKKEKLKGAKTELLDIIDRSISKGKQSLVFVNTRKGAESTAEKVGDYISTRLSPEEKSKLEKLSGKVSKTLESSTKQCERLAKCIRKGTAFHHAGLVSSQRQLVEKSFRDGTLRLITATPTLAMGLNLPSYQAVIRDLKRFSTFKGMDFIPALEIEQMCGRAGRLKYDTEGEAVMLTKSRAEAEVAWERYILGDTENIYSKLGVEPVLRMHVLALIASGIASNREELFEFFFKTFYAYQYKDLSAIKSILEKVISQLESFKFIEAGGSQDMGEFQTAASMVKPDDSPLKATRIGRRVSELYIDPVTANRLIEKLGRLKDSGLTHFGLLQLVSDTAEMRPLLNIRKGDMEYINEVILKEEKSLAEPPPDPWRFEYDIFLKSVKTAAFFQDWTDEWGEAYLLEKFNVTPGELRARLERVDWLLYSAQELALLLNYMPILKDIRKSRLRVKYGIREELMPFVKLKNIGRVKARKMFSAGIKTMAELRKVSPENLGKAVGPQTAKSIKVQLGEA